MVASRRPALRRVRNPLTAPLTVPLAVLLSAVLAAPTAALVSGPAAAAAPTGYYQMPFPCGQMWTGTTRSYHSPSPHSVDFNRPDDYRDQVVASAAGTVTTAYSYPSGGYGRWVRIDHGNGRTSLYAHLDQTAVKAGEKVAQGELIGYLGTSGNSSGPHLHYEQREGSRVVPARFDGKAYGYGTSTSRNCPQAATVSKDLPLAGNLDAGANSELVIFRLGSPSTFIVKRWKKTKLRIQLGGIHALPVIGDWDGQGREDLGIRQPNQRRTVVQTPAGTTNVTWGWKKDLPIAGDWDGDGDDDLGLHRPTRRKILLRDDDGSVTRLWLGDTDDVAVVGDWNGDGRTDTAAFDRDTATFTLRTVQPDGRRSIERVAYGAPGDLPVVGDWNGDGATDLGVWRPSEATFHKRRPKAGGGYRTEQRRFGRPY